MTKKSINEYMKMWTEKINTEFSNPPSKIKDILTLFRKLNDEMQKEKFYPNPENILEFLKIPNYLKATEQIINTYRDKIEKGLIEYEIYDDLVLMTIECYCMINGIEIKTDSSESEEEIDLKKDTTEEYLSETSDIKKEISYNRDILREYLKEIGKYKLLTPEQEKELAYRIKEGDQEARSLFTNSNLRLVVSIAKRYQGRGLELMDLIQEGNIGLITSVERFDVTRGYRFSTYATGWIRQAITRSIENKGRTIRIPVHYYERITALKKAETKLSNLYNREPTLEELANELSISLKNLKQLYQSMSEPVSINTKVGEDEDTEFGDFIPINEQSIEDKIVDESLFDAIQKLFQECNLKKQDIDILILRFGLDGNEPRTLEDIGAIYHITRERVRQIESKAIKKIRRSKYIKDLAIYLESPDSALESLERIRKKYLEEKRSNKAYLIDRGKTKESKIEQEMNKMPKLHTIYQYLSDYTKKQIDEMIENLSEEDRELIKRRYGDNLDNPVVSKLTQEELSRFYGSLVPKMKRHLKKQTMISKKKNETDSSESRIPKGRKPKTQERQTNNIPKEKSRSKKPSKMNNPKNAIEAGSTSLGETKPKEEPLLLKEDYERLLVLVQSKSFTDLLQYVSPKEATIISLRFGFVDNKFFTPKSISDFLGVTDEEIKNATRKVLFLLKEDTDSFLERIFQFAVEEKSEENEKYLVKVEK